jgi:hypothetical protein
VENAALALGAPYSDYTNGFILRNMTSSKMCLLVFNTSLDIFFSFWQYCGLNSGLCTSWTGAPTLEPRLQPSCFDTFGDWVLLYAQLA